MDLDSRCGCVLYSAGLADSLTAVSRSDGSTTAYRQFQVVSAGVGFHPPREACGETWVFADSLLFRFACRCKSAACCFSESRILFILRDVLFPQFTVQPYFASRHEARRSHGLVAVGAEIYESIIVV